MKTLTTTLLMLLLPAIAGMAQEKSEFIKELEVNYSILNQDLLNNPGEVTTVSNFVYEKDVATFTFEEGEIFLLRYVWDRPTTALFVGKGRAEIRIPSHVERESMTCVLQKSELIGEAITTEFDICFMRIGDDFDKRLREQYSFETRELEWKTFSKIKEAQGEVFFKPIINHEYDNYFQLLRSCYERSADGYFWADFGRYVFSFDPNRPEETYLSYEFEGGDIDVIDGVRMQRMEEQVYVDSSMSNLDYPTTRLEVHGRLELGGLDGKKLERGQASLSILVNADSLRFMSLFKHFNLRVDSAWFNGAPTDLLLREDFEFVGVVLPEYVYRNDTVEVTLFYHGKDFDYALPWVENPAPAMHHVEFNIRRDFNYLVPGKTETQATNGADRFIAAPDKPMTTMYFQPYATGADTISQISSIGLTVNIIDLASIDKRYYPSCYIPDDIYRSSTINAINYLSETFGPPMGSFELWVYPEGFMSMPGIVELPQVACVREGTMEAVGGFNQLAGHAVARQYFGPLLQNMSYRERWIHQSAPQYLSLMFLQNRVAGAQFYSNLLARRDSIYTIYDQDRQMPIAVGDRANETYLSNMGIWFWHMLRFLFFDPEQQSVAKFDRLMHEIYVTANSKPFTNADVVRIAEKHYGGDLDWFFNQWLYATNLPKFNVEYSVEAQEDGSYMVPVRVETTSARENFTMPVLMRVEADAGTSTYHRETVTAGTTEFVLGPLQARPDKLHFNEFFSVLSKDNVSKK